MTSRKISFWKTVPTRPGALLLLLAALTGLSASNASPAPTLAQGPTVLFTFDARPLNGLDLHSGTNALRVWDTLHAFAALQGLVNRDQPRLYLFYCSEFGVDTDQFWFDWLRQEDGWLKGADVVKLPSLEEALRTFRTNYQGIVIYDPKVPATACIASTVSGCDNLLPIRYDPVPGSVYDLVVRKLNVPIRVWLVNPDGSSRFTGRDLVPDLGIASSGSAKIDAYRWAVEKYIKSGKCEAGLAAYYLDSYWLRYPTQAGPTMHTLSNHDFFIARRGFFFDLSPWGDEKPNDDPAQQQGADRAQLLAMMRALHERANGGLVKVGGFVPWPHKYTTHSKPPNRHDGVPTEWEFGRLISQFNGYMEADAAGLAALANASFYQHYPLAAKYPQPNPKPGIEDWRRRGLLDAEGKPANRLFVGHYAGDYDAPSWLYKGVAAFFRDPARGRVPVGWAFDPNLADRVPQALVYAYRNATTNDFFIAGDSGAGYLNPRALTVRPDSGLPSGLGAWTAHCRRYYERWGMSITGFILDGAGGGSTELEFKAYQEFSPDGAGTHFEAGPGMRGGMPTCPERDLPDEAEKAAEVIAGVARKRGEKPGFLWARSILKSPAWYAKVSDLLAKRHADLGVVVVDPYTFFGLIRLREETSRQ
jgi:hypothetical protein